MMDPSPTVPDSQRFPRSLRLLRRSEFLVAQSRGRRVHTEHFVLLLHDRADGAPARLGVTASRKSGNSVRRNRVRRCIREVFRRNATAFPVGFDCVVIVRENAPDQGYEAIRTELLDALSRRDRRPFPPGAKRSGDTKKPRPSRPSTT